MNYSDEAATKFCKKYGFKIPSHIHDDASEMIRKEAEKEIKNGTFKKQKNQWSKALEVALNRASIWYVTGLEFKTEPLHEFVAQCRRPCIYFVLLKKYIKEEGGKKE
jgi:hypothetical protein